MTWHDVCVGGEVRYLNSWYLMPSHYLVFVIVLEKNQQIYCHFSENVVLTEEPVSMKTEKVNFRNQNCIV